jgi:hypothetical protein
MRVMINLPPRQLQQRLIADGSLLRMLSTPSCAWSSSFSIARCLASGICRVSHEAYSALVRRTDEISATVSNSVENRKGTVLIGRQISKGNAADRRIASGAGV